MSGLTWTDRIAFWTSSALRSIKKMEPGQDSRASVRKVAFLAFFPSESLLCWPAWNTPLYLHPQGRRKTGLCRAHGPSFLPSCLEWILFPAECLNTRARGRPEQAVLAVENSRRGHFLREPQPWTRTGLWAVFPGEGKAQRTVVTL